MSNLNPTQDTANGWKVGGNDVPISGGTVKAFPTTADIPANFTGVAQVGGELFVGDGDRLDKIADDVASRLSRRLSMDIAMEDSVMSVPPTITVGADYAGPTQPNTVLYKPDGAEMYSPSKWSMYFANWHGFDTYKPISGTYASSRDDTGINAPLSFCTDADIIEIVCHAQQSWSTEMIVDGKRVSNDLIVTATVASGAVLKVIKVNFGSVKFRNITIFASTNYHGVAIASKFTVLNPKAPNLTLLAISHSWEGGGAGYSAPFTFVNSLAYAIGHGGCVGINAGGSGYTKRGSGGNQKVAYEHLRSFVESGFIPDILFVSTGTNDQSSSSTDAEILAAIDQFYDYVEVNLPNCLCVVVETCVASWDLQGQPRFSMVTDKVKAKLAGSKIKYIFQNFHNGNIETSAGNVVDNTAIQAAYLNHPKAIFTGVTWTGGADTGGNSKLYSDAYPNGHPTGAAGAAGLSTGRGYLNKYIFSTIKKGISKLTS